MMPTSLRRSFAIVLVIAVAVIGWNLLNSGANASGGAATATAASPLDGGDAGKGTFTKARLGTLVMSQDVDGVFVPGDAFEVRLKVRRYQGDLLVRKAIAQGSKVAKGDLLLELQSDSYDLQRAAAENDLTLADANLAKARSDVKLGMDADTLAMNLAKRDLDISQTDLKRWDDREQSIFVLGGSMDGRIADFSVENASDELDQLKKMYKSEDLTNETADIVMKRATKTLELQKLMANISHAATDRATQFDVNVKRDQLVRVVERQTQGIAQLTAEHAQAKVVRETGLASARAGDEAARKKLEELNGDGHMFSVTSPIDGVVVFGAFEHKAWSAIEPEKFAAGEKVAADQVLMTVYTPGNLRVAADWPEAKLATFTAGAKIGVSPVAFTELHYEGTCRPASIVGQAKGAAQAFEVLIDLPAVDARLAPGYRADLNLDAGKVENVLVVPATAVLHNKAWVGTSGTEPEARPVVVGRSDGRNIEIKSGLKEGDSVLTTAPHAE